MKNRKHVRSCTVTLLASAIAMALSPVYAGSTHHPASPVAAKSPLPAQQADNATTDQKEEAATKLTGITVTGQLAALRQEAQTKRSAVGVVDSISAEEAGKFPDQNVADALQRVPGVSVNRGGGASSEVTVRGLGPTFVNVLLNGRVLPSADSSRAFNFAVLPSEMISEAIVKKTGSADNPAGGIGGTINIITAKPLDYFGFHASATVGGNESHIGGGFGGKVTPRISATIGDTNSDGSFGWLLSAVENKRDYQVRTVSTSAWYPNLDFTRIDPSLKSIGVPGTVAYAVNRVSTTRKALMAAAEWRPIKNLTINFNSFLSRYDTDSDSTSFGSYHNFDDIDTLTADANGTALRYTRVDAPGKVVMANDYINSGGPSHEFTGQTGLNIKYRLDSSTEIDADFAYSRVYSNGHENNWFYVMGVRNYGTTPLFVNNGTELMPAYHNLVPTTDTSELYAHYLVNGGTNIDGRAKQGRLHLSKTFVSSMLARLDFGVSARKQSKSQIGYQIPNQFLCSEYCGYTAHIPADAVGAYVFHPGSLPSAGPGAPTGWVNYDPQKYIAWLATAAAYNQRPDAAAFVAKLKANGGGFAARRRPSTFSQIDEQVRSAYAKAKLQGNLGKMPWVMNVGLRYTKTNTTAHAIQQELLSLSVDPQDVGLVLPTYGPEKPIETKGSYFNWLPSLNFRLNITDKLIFRAAWSKTLTRPDLGDLAAFRVYNFAPHSESLQLGNTDLKPFVSKNLDLGLEYYFGGASYVALDAFHKSVDNFVTKVTTIQQIQGLPFHVTRPVNLNNAAVKGLEGTFNYQLTRLENGWHWLDGIGFAVNYTHVTSNATVSTQDIAEGKVFAIPGIGDSANASIYYDKGPVELRFAYNWRGTYLSTIANYVGEPVTVKPYGQLDFSTSVDLNKHFSVFFNVTNLNNEQIHRYQIYLNRPVLAEADGRTYSAGVRMSF